LRRPLRLALALLLLAAAVVSARTARPASTPPILGTDGRPVPGSVATLEEVSLGGVPQWILVRGRDRTRPIVLFLHGGPGMPAMFLAHAWQRDLEHDFVVVHWDRRGAGKSYGAGADPAGLTVRRTLDDLHELTALLRERLGSQRILLVGHSWGSHLGLLAVRERPDDFLAFVGTGQVAGSREEVRNARRALLVEAARAAGDDRAAARFEAGAVPTEDDLFAYGLELYGERSFWPLLRIGLRAPEYGLRDAWNLKRGADRVGRLMREDVAPGAHEGEVEALDVPAFLVLGRHDGNTPPELAVAWLERLQAPGKGFEWLERSAHFPFLEEPARFREALVRAEAAARAIARR